jgi:pimeloyl-[acyl-carrier protein] methyl ester esterase
MTFAAAGQGGQPPLALVHGWGLGSGAWEPVAVLLAPTFSVQRFDLPGYGGTEAAPRATLDDLADVLADSLPPQSTVCGWSLGALVCLQAAQRHPDKLARLILVGATACFVEREGWPEAMPAAQLESFMADLDADPGALLKQFAKLIHQGDGQQRAASRALRNCLENAPGGLPADVETLRAGLALLGSADLRAVLPAVRQPVLLIHGGVDPLMPVAAGERLVATLPAAQLSVFESSAHAPFASDPQRFISELCHFAGVVA